ncbi:hypothetical protein AX761_20915 [Rhizobium sp. 58]|nr:hypothetical protein AX761_20915 [Rhizobium sp. 58]
MIDGNRSNQLDVVTVFDDVLVNSAGTTARVPGPLLTAIVQARVGPNKELRSELIGDTAWNDGAIGTVWGDPDEAKRGTYVKTGDYLAGSWTRIGPLPPSSIAEAMVQEAMEILESLIIDLAFGYRLMGGWTPPAAFPAGAQRGDAWVASGAGSAGGIAFSIGDMLVAVKDNPSTTVYASNWLRVPRPVEAVRHCNTISDLRAVPKESGSMTVRGYAAAGDGGGGHFYVKDQVASKPEVPGLYVVANDGAGWERTWDGRNFFAAWVGCTPAVADLGPFFALFPKYCEIHFSSGKYTVATYPSEANFANRLYRGVSVIWNCTGALTATQAAFTWHYTASGAFGSDGSGNNNTDMTHAGVSPIEGIGIISALGRSFGIGFRMSNGGHSNYFLRPQKFSIGGFYEGFKSAVPLSNFFLLGLEDVVIKGCRRGVVIDNTASFNSGENTWIRRCYIGNCDEDGIVVSKMQMLSIEGTSLDYNRRHLRAIDSLVKIQNCYLETNAVTTPAEMISAEGVSKITIDCATNIYGLPVALGDIFAVSGIASIICENPSVFFSNGPAGATSVNRAPFILYNGPGTRVFGRVSGGNGDNYARLLSKHSNLFSDAEFASGGLTFCPGSTAAAVVSDIVRPGRTYSAKLTFPGTTTGAQLAFHRMRVRSGEWLFIMHFDKIVGTIVNLAHRLQFFTADGVKIGDDRFIGGAAMPANFTYFPDIVTEDWTSSAHDWRLQRAVAEVPIGADYVLAQLRIDPNSTGAYYVSDYYAYQ